MKSILCGLIIILLFSASTFSLQAQVFNSPRDGVFDKVHTTERKPIPYTAVRESDVIWQKRIWREIDFRQKINHPFYYPEKAQTNWKSFMTILMEAIREGSITAYDATNDDQFLVPLTSREIENKFVSINVEPKYDPFNPQLIIGYDTVETGLDPTMVDRIRIKEDWFFDKQRSVMDVRIIGILPLRKVYDQDNFIGREQLFWIYFPEARPVFAKTEVFNRQNGAERRTYDDIFWKRIFGSYIYKEENVYDREISKYASGMDALLESERIKDELFLFEHELWEF